MTDDMYMAIGSLITREYDDGIGHYNRVRCTECWVALVTIKQQRCDACMQIRHALEHLGLKTSSVAGDWYHCNEAPAVF